MIKPTTKLGIKFDIMLEDHNFLNFVYFWNWIAIVRGFFGLMLRLDEKHKQFRVSQIVEPVRNLQKRRRCGFDR